MNKTDTITNVLDFMIFLNKEYPKIYQLFVKCSYNIEGFSKIIGYKIQYKDLNNSLYNYLELLKFIRNKQHLHNLWMF